MLLHPAFGPLALAATLLSPLVTAMPTKLSTRKTSALTAQAITSIDPTTSSCASAPAAGECRTAAQSAPYIALSFANFGLHSFGEQAALLSLMLYESDGFKYSKNHFPGRPGQGTRNMQMPEYNLKYAWWLAEECANCGVSSREVERAKAQGVEAVLGLVNGDMWGFGSAAWFLATQCGEDVRQGLKGGSQQGWENYLSSCVGTTATEDRTAIWRKAVQLGSW